MDFDLNEAEKKHIELCKKSLRAKTLIESQPIEFDHYMNHVLYDAECGYYMSSLYKIGQKGDFITAPEISPTFAHCFANASTKVLNSLDRPTVIEIGAGRGSFAIEYLKALKHLKVTLPEYHILELSPDMRQVQQQQIAEQLPDEKDRVRWITQLPDDPIEGVIIANEVMDAMPVKRFCKRGNTVYSGTVKLADNELQWDQQPGDDVLTSQVKAIEQALGPFGDGYTSEINLWLKPWIASLYQSMAKGVVLLCDYGYSQNDYYHPQRFMGTLQCYHKHQAFDDPLALPGLADITAHVNFTEAAQAAVDSGFEIEGFTTQGHFLMENYTHLPADLAHSVDLSGQQSLKKLILPSGMGETFKVLGLAKAYDDDVVGFDHFDLSHLL